MRSLSLARIGLCAAALSACSGPNAASAIATPPTFEPKGQTKCGVSKSQAKPLIVEWPSADRGELETRAKQGLVAVRYEGCEMEVLDRCRVPGTYAYAAVTRKDDRITMRDADELYANIPVYAAKFEGKLQRSGGLGVAMTIVGRWVASRSTIRADELEGECARATHVITGLTTGAFEFYAGVDAEVGAGASVAGLGAQATSTSSREMLNRDGDAAACAKSSDEDRKPPQGCGALLRVEVAPLAAGSRAPAEAPAPAATAPTPKAIPREAPAPVAKAPEPLAPAPVAKAPVISDRDGDGLLDADDACPDVAGWPDPDRKKSGCPRAPATDPRIRVADRWIQLAEPIQFETAKPAIRPASFPQLDALADVLQRRPEIRLVVEGHSDSAGNAAFNQRLTQERADAVRAYLVAHGVAADRLTAKGYGQDMPVADNRTAEGRAKNRRIELRRTDKP